MNPFQEYVAHGWALTRIEPGLKAPKRQKWNTREKAITDPEKAQWLESAGLCHAWSGTAALDIDRLDDSVDWLCRTLSGPAGPGSGALRRREEPDSGPGPDRSNPAIASRIAGTPDL